jgi:hypothetical protein
MGVVAELYPPIQSVSKATIMQNESPGAVILVRKYTMLPYDYVKRNNGLQIKIRYILRGMKSHDRKNNIKWLVHINNVPTLR